MGRLQPEDLSVTPNTHLAEAERTLKSCALTQTDTVACVHLHTNQCSTVIFYMGWKMLLT